MMRVYIYDGTDPKHVLVRGPVGQSLKAAKVPALWSNRSRGWWLRRERVADVLAQLDRQGYDVRSRRGDAR